MNNGDATNYRNDFQRTAMTIKHNNQGTNKSCLVWQLMSY